MTKAKTNILDVAGKKTRSKAKVSRAGDRHPQTTVPEDVHTTATTSDGPARRSPSKSPAKARKTTVYVLTDAPASSPETTKEDTTTESDDGRREEEDEGRR
ncbi:Aste57867_15050 [Aphanomyces stellatus]|uniref:Aste57867_15050 protein n=1 Tax=Aphanomyces stellatus TaxID=120398 RepID=A0A485L2T5_9STRA|nr:hypothetical protein As57867_014994 [Aphanomyces stellatus]VFT91864.1 Aste57867_15050 [Aphanomyces stellatus]